MKILLLNDHGAALGGAEIQLLGHRDWLPLMAQMTLLHRWRGAFRGIVANSAAVADRLRAEGFPEVEVIGNGVPPSAMRGALADVPTVAFAGRLEPEKGVDVLLDAMARLEGPGRQAQLLVAGSGKQAARLAERAATLGLGSRARFLGHLEHGTLQAALDGASVRAVPSRWDEPFGLVAAEAMMRGTPVVASRAGGLADIVPHEEAGLLVPLGDAAALAAALDRLLADRALCERMGRAGRSHALRHLTRAASADRFLAAYDRLVRGTGTAHPPRDPSEPARVHA